MPFQPDCWHNEALMETATAIQEFIEYVIVQLIDEPDKASVIHEIDGEEHQYLIRLAETDTGRVIGKGGNTITAIRSLASAAAQKNGMKISVEIDD